MLPPLISIWLCPAVSVMLLAGVSRCSKGLAKRFTGSARACPPWAFLASWPPTLPSVAALRLGVHLLGVVLQRLLGVVAGQALRPLLAGALAQGLAQLAGAFELRHGLHRVHLAAGHAAAHGRAGRGGEQQSLARAHHGPAVGGAVKAFSQPLAPAGVARSALAAVLNEVAQAQLAPAGGRAVAGQAHAQLARGVVHHPLVGALAV